MNWWRATTEVAERSSSVGAHEQTAGVDGRESAMNVVICGGIGFSGKSLATQAIVDRYGVKRGVLANTGCANVCETII